MIEAVAGLPSLTSPQGVLVFVSQELTQLLLVGIGDRLKSVPFLGCDT